MKHILSLLLIFTLLSSCKNEVQPEIKTVDVETESLKKLDPNAKYAKAEFTIEGMTCAVGCAASIQKNLGKMEGVKSAIVDFDKKLAMIEYDEAKVTPNTIEATVINVSDTYKIKNMKTVNDFSVAKKCGHDCKKECCANKDKKTCASDCKKACCVSKKEA